jgi:hypothetical protein
MKKILIVASMAVSLNVFAQAPQQITLKAFYTCQQPSSIKGHFDVTVEYVKTGEDPHRATLGKAFDEAVRQLPSQTPGKGGCIIESIMDF